MVAQRTRWNKTKCVPVYPAVPQLLPLEWGKKTNVVVESTQIGDVRTLVGYRPLDNCNDQNEDIYLKGD